jgi:hypothetical protein
MFVKVTNDQIDQYPYTVGDLRRDNPNTSFPKQVPEATMAQYGMYPVGYAAAPDYNPDTHRIQNSNMPELVDGKWTLTKTVVELTPEQLEDRKAQKRRQIKDRRDKAINAGTTSSGMTIATDDLSQQRITGAALSATIDPTTTVKWKMPDDTFVGLDSNQIIVIAQLVRAHVQACFNREAELLAALDAGQAYDIDAGWPQ